MVEISALSGLVGVCVLRLVVSGLELVWLVGLVMLVVASRLAAGLATAEEAKGLCWIRYLPGGPSTGNPATMTVFAGN